jgi:hypothetical protein
VVYNCLYYCFPHFSLVGSEWSGLPWGASGHHGSQWGRENDASEHAHVPLTAHSAGQRSSGSERSACQFQHSGQSVCIRATTRPLHRDADSARTSYLPGTHCICSSYENRRSSRTTYSSLQLVHTFHKLWSCDDFIVNENWRSPQNFWFLREVRLSP